MSPFFADLSKLVAALIESGKVGEYPIAHLNEIEDKGRLDTIHLAAA
jgi:hypothetical protein